MKEAFSGLGLRTAGAGSACGQLSRYIYSADAYENVASQRHALELLLAHFDFVKGLIGGRIKAVRLVTGSFRIESLWKAVRSGRTASGRFMASESVCDPVLDHRAAGLKIIDVFLEPGPRCGLLWPGGQWSPPPKPHTAPHMRQQLADLLPCSDAGKTALPYFPILLRLHLVYCSAGFPLFDKVLLHRERAGTAKKTPHGVTRSI